MRAEQRMFGSRLKHVQPQGTLVMTQESHSNRNACWRRTSSMCLPIRGSTESRKVAASEFCAEDVATLGCHQDRDGQELDERADFGLDHRQQLLRLIGGRYAQTTSRPLHPASIRPAIGQ